MSQSLPNISDPVRGNNAALIDAYRTEMRVTGGLAAATAYEYARSLARCPYELPGDRRDALAWMENYDSPRRHLDIAKAVKSFSRWWAMDNEAADPLASLRYPKVPASPPQRIARDDDVERITAVLKLDARSFLGSRDLAIWCVLRDIGMRRSECARLTASDLRETPGFILIRQTKNNDPRYVPMSAEIRSALHVWLRNRTFKRHSALPALWLTHRGVLTNNGIMQAMREWNVRAKLTEHPITAHQLRRRFSANWARSGKPDDTLMTIGGWKDARMPMRYRSELVRERAYDDYFKVMGEQPPEAEVIDLMPRKRKKLR